MARDSAHPIIQQLRMRNRLMNVVIDKIDTSYLTALTSLENPDLARRLLGLKRLRKRYVRQLSQIFDIPNDVDIPKPILQFMAEPPKFIEELAFAVGLVFNFRALPVMMMKSDYTALNQMFGETAVSAAFAERKLAPFKGEVESVPIDSLDPAIIYEDGICCIKKWSEQQGRDISNWMSLMLPPTIDDNPNDPIVLALEANYTAHGANIVNRMYATLKQLQSPQQKQPRPAGKSPQFTPPQGAANGAGNTKQNSPEVA